MLSYFCLFHWPAAEPLADARRTLGFHRETPVENHWFLFSLPWQFYNSITGSHWEFSKIHLRQSLFTCIRWQVTPHDCISHVKVSLILLNTNFAVTNLQLSVCKFVSNFMLVTLLNLCTLLTVCNTSVITIYSHSNMSLLSLVYIQVHWVIVLYAACARWKIKICTLLYVG